MASNVERLEAAGLIKKTPLPESYQSIVDGLSDAEVEALIGVGSRLRELSDVQAHAYDEEPPPDEFFVLL